MHKYQYQYIHTNTATRTFSKTPKKTWIHIHSKCFNLATYPNQIQQCMIHNLIAQLLYFYLCLLVICKWLKSGKEKTKTANGEILKGLGGKVLATRSVIWTQWNPFCTFNVVENMKKILRLMHLVEYHLCCVGCCCCCE